jgi:ketosteroid isomerase-like protein
MPATTAEEAHRLWADAFKRGDVDAVLELYEQGAVFVAQPGAPLARGKDAVREVVRTFVAMGGTFNIEPTDSIECDGVAVLYAKWTLEGGSDADGNAIELAGHTTDVVRRRSDGTWLFAIDNPWGVQAFAAPAATA